MRLLHQREHFPEEMCRRQSALIAEKLFIHPAYAGCRRLFSYVSFRREVDTYEIMRRALADGKMVAAPRVSGKEMDFHEISCLEELKKGAYGIPEPAGGKLVCPAKGDLILLPGAAFDRRGRRIGYGGGYYDRYLEKYPEGCRIGLAYSFQVLTHLPAEEYDLPADEVLTV